MNLVTKQDQARRLILSGMLEGLRIPEVGRTENDLVSNNCGLCYRFNLLLNDNWAYSLSVYSVESVSSSEPAKPW